MLYYPDVEGKANQFCIETAWAIRRYLQDQDDPDLRKPFTARDLTAAGIKIPHGGLSVLRNRGWLQRVGATPAAVRAIWCLTESARIWQDQQALQEGACSSSA